MTRRLIVAVGPIALACAVLGSVLWLVLPSAEDEGKSTPGGDDMSLAVAQTINTCSTLPSSETMTSWFGTQLPSASSGGQADPGVFDPSCLYEESLDADFSVFVTMPKRIMLGAINPQLDIDLDEWDSTEAAVNHLKSLPHVEQFQMDGVDLYWTGSLVAIKGNSFVGVKVKVSDEVPESARRNGASRLAVDILNKWRGPCALVSGEEMNAIARAHKLDVSASTSSSSLERAGADGSCYPNFGYSFNYGGYVYGRDEWRSVNGGSESWVESNSELYFRPSGEEDALFTVTVDEHAGSLSQRRAAASDIAQLLMRRIKT